MNRSLIISNSKLLPERRTEGEDFDFLIKDGLILTLSPAHPDPLPTGCLGIKDNRITYLGDRCPEVWTAREVIDGRGFLLLPGLINTHTHAAMTLFRGLADDLPLKDWLEKHIFPAEARFINPDSVYWGTLLACAEMIRSGTTTLADGYFCLDGSARAISQSGMRAVLAPGVIDFPAPGCPDPADNIRVARDFIEKWEGLSPRIRLGVFPHSPYTCSTNTLKKVRDLALGKKIPFFIHLAETREEGALVQGQTGLTSVRYLQRLGCLDTSFIGVHVNYPVQEEMELLAEAGARVSHCPESNMKLGAGVTPVLDLLARGIVVGLGTDGCAGNNDLDLFREMGTAARLHKVNRLDPTFLEARSVLKMTTLEGAKVLGLEKEIGSLEVGKQADLILIDLNQPHLTPLYHPFSHLVYAASGADVDTVFIAGQMVMRQRKLLTLDWKEIRERVVAISREIRMLSLGGAGVGDRSGL
jgi:5-methylthioadenosine/S-adenosylhomocysteine deaminase